MKIVATSDLHGHLPAIPECDLLLIAGDLCPDFHLDEILNEPDRLNWFQRRWLNTEFREWLETVPARHVVGIAGNHDHIFRDDPRKVPADLRWVYLQDSATIIDGLTIYGTPWQRWFGNWPFMAEEPQLSQIWSNIPEHLDILLVHGPPYGIGDETRTGPAGSVALRQRILEVQPRYVFCGHIHENPGHVPLGQSEIFNVAFVDNGYQPSQMPICLDIMPRSVQ